MKTILYPSPTEKPQVWVVIETLAPLTREEEQKKANTMATVLDELFKRFGSRLSFAQIRDKVETLDPVLATQLYMVKW